MVPLFASEPLSCPVRENGGRERGMEIMARLFVAAGVLVMVACWGQQAHARTKAKLWVEVECLALTVYFEARGEPDDGKRAVAHVVMNRVSDARFPDTVCGVVRQGGETDRYRCQFSWWCDGRGDTPANAAAWKRSADVAYWAFKGFSKDPTGGALWFHAESSSPSWRKAFQRGPKIGGHVFYRDAGRGSVHKTAHRPTAVSSRKAPGRVAQIRIQVDPLIDSVIVPY